MAKDTIGAPQFVRYFGPVLDALQELGGSGRPDEVRSRIALSLKVSEKEQSELLPSKVQPRFDNQVHWARFYLSKAGYIGSSKRGVWSLTERGRTAIPLTLAGARDVFKSLQSTLFKMKGEGTEALLPPADDGLSVTNESDISYVEQVLSRLQALLPGGLEEGSNQGWSSSDRTCRR